jgi:hypothetical protein
MFTEGENALRNYLTAVSRPVAQRSGMLRQAITFSRQTGAGALPVANLVARQLDVDFSGDPPCSWIVFDRNLITKVLEDHHLSKQIEEFLPEDARFPLTVSRQKAMRTVRGVYRNVVISISIKAVSR